MWYNLNAPCQVCGKLTTGQSGLICGNYAHNRGNLGKCRGAWCPDCYKADPLLKFPIKRIEEEDGVELEDDTWFFLKVRVVKSDQVLYWLKNLSLTGVFVNNRVL